MSELSKKKSEGLARQDLEPHDPTFQAFSQIQLVIPCSVFDRAGVELTYESVMKLVDDVLLKMPRFYGFRCDRKYWHDHQGNGRVILQRTHFGDVVNLRLPDDFVFPPVAKNLPPTKLPE